VNQRYIIKGVRAENVAIGDHARAGDEVHPDPRQASIQVEALQQIRQLIELIVIHTGAIENPREVQANARSVEIALKKKKPNRTRITYLIGKITPAVAGVTALANAIDAVQALVNHL
jgi:hypothetical protein